MRSKPVAGALLHSDVHRCVGREGRGQAPGVPEESIAQDWNDPVRAAFAQRGILYDVNWIGEYFNVVSTPTLILRS
jgi:porin